MKIIKVVLVLLIQIPIIVSCKSDRKKSLDNESEHLSTDIAEVISEGMEFQMNDTLSYGWNTFRYINKSNDVHFFILEKLPDGIRIENYKNELIPPFKKATELLLEGNIEDGLKEFENIPSWFSKVKVSGGVGLISPNMVGESTIYLEPGIYAMECYIRMANGMAHVYYGMLKEVVVSETKSMLPEPIATVNLSVSSSEGIVLQDSIIGSGEQTFKIHFKDQITYKTMLGHDVNLVRLNSFNLIDTLNSWINAADLNAFRTPEPEGLTFLGGVNDLESGETGYFKTTLKPGKYAFISEVPDAKSKGLLKTFEVID